MVCEVGDTPSFLLSCIRFLYSIHLGISSTVKCVHSCSELHPSESMMLSQVSLGVHRVNVFEHNTSDRR